MTFGARWIPLAACVALLALPTPGEAQRRPGGSPDRARIEQRIRAQVGRMMQQRLDLDDDEAARLSEVAQVFERRRRDLARREFETRGRVDALLESGADEEEARSLLALQVELRTLEAELFAEEQEALLEILTPTQLIRLQDLREDLGRRIRALRGGGRPDADGPRGPGPDGRRGARMPRGDLPPLS